MQRSVQVQRRDVARLHKWANAGVGSPWNAARCTPAPAVIRLHRLRELARVSAIKREAKEGSRVSE